ncbi:MAG: hypothetical protein AAF549_09445 [Pseudomonadota bacterium]
MNANAALAFTAQGQVSATIVNPKNMSEEEIKEFCLEAPDASQCDLLTESIEEEIYDDTLSAMKIITRDYDVLNRNYE